MGHQLQQQRIVVDGHRASRVDPGFDPDAVPRGQDQLRHRARRRQEALRRVLGIHATLDRRPALDDLGLGPWQLLARRDPELGDDQVEPRGFLRDRVLDLEPGVHLQEVELPTL